MPNQRIISMEAVEECLESAFIESALSEEEVERAMCADADHLQEARCVFLFPASAPCATDQGKPL